MAWHVCWQMCCLQLASNMYPSDDDFVGHAAQSEASWVHCRELLGFYFVIFYDFKMCQFAQKSSTSVQLCLVSLTDVNLLVKLNCRTRLANEAWHCMPVSYCVLCTFMPPWPAAGGKGIMCSSSPSIVHPSILIPHDMIFTYCRDFNETCHKYSLCEWELLKRVSRSKIKGQGHGWML